MQAQNIHNEYIGTKKRFKEKLLKIESEISEYMKKNKSEKIPKDLKAEWETLIVDLTTKLKFGKHKGRSIEQIMNTDFTYILWLFKENIVKLDKTNKGLYYLTKKILDKKYEEYKESIRNQKQT